MLCYFYVIFIFIILHCPLSGPDLIYISLLIIPCLIYYVTNKETPFKMVSQFGSLGYTIMGKTADLTVVQKTIIDTLHKEGKPTNIHGQRSWLFTECWFLQDMLTESWVEGKKCGRKRCINQTERNRSLMRIVKQNRFKEFGGELHKEWSLRLGSRHQEQPHTDVSRKLATVVVSGVSPGTKGEEKLGLLPSGPKSSFQMRGKVLSIFPFGKPRS